MSFSIGAIVGWSNFYSYQSQHNFSLYEIITELPVQGNLRRGLAMMSPTDGVADCDGFSYSTRYFLRSNQNGFGWQQSTRNAASSAADTWNRTAPSPGKVLTMETLNPNIKAMEYAVRGPIVTRAAEIDKELKQVRIDRWLTNNLFL